ncbi:MAG: hypothetical protein K1Y02_02605 [Candidatus Hydrogenedentes bacterium]|nr:hypothetical protein [Candidatus Hydrogenedentota bacterium]
MKRSTHIRTLSHARPSMAGLEPVWELIYLLQAIIGLTSSFLGQGGAILSQFKSS